jgi:hypothetical protein
MLARSSPAQRTKWTRLAGQQPRSIPRVTEERIPCFGIRRVPRSSMPRSKGAAGQPRLLTLRGDTFLRCGTACEQRRAYTQYQELGRLTYVGQVRLLLSADDLSFARNLGGTSCSGGEVAR